MDAAWSPCITGAHRQNGPVHIPAKVDYGLRALLSLAADPDPQTAESLAEAQNLPPKFLTSILADLRRAGLVVSQRGVEGGYRLAREPKAITAAEVIRALDGPLAEVRGFRPESTSYEGAAEHLRELWIAVRASLRAVLEYVTLEELASGRMPRTVSRLTRDEEAWKPH